MRILQYIFAAPLLLLASALRCDAFSVLPTTTTSTRSSTPKSFYYDDSNSPNHQLFGSSSNVDPATSPLIDLIPPDWLDEFTLYWHKEDHYDLQEGQRLVMIGDVHGDVDQFDKCLSMAGLMDFESKKWIANNTIFVQTGDILDRGNQELQCLKRICQLSQQAQAVGGTVLCLFGNHEVLNALGTFQYTTGEWEYEQVVGQAVDTALDGNKAWRMQYSTWNQPSRWAAFEPGGLFSDCLMRKLKVAVTVGRTACVHAGLTHHHLEKYGSITEMNAEAKTWMQTRVNIPNNNLGNYTSSKAAIDDAELRQTFYFDTCPKFLSGGKGGDTPVWMRDFSSPANMPPLKPNAMDNLSEVLEELDCDRMIMGHTIQTGGINSVSTSSGQAWRIDTGMSRGCGAGPIEALQVQMVDGQEVLSILTENGPVEAADRETVANMLL